MWKSIKGFEHLYLISDNGKVFSVRQNREIRFNIINGYPKINLSNKGKRKAFFIHRLVAEHFLEPVVGKKYVNHIDGNKKNNNVKNLEWCTLSENIQHADKNGLRNIKSYNNGNSKLSKEDIEYILLHKELKTSELAKKFNVTRQCIYYVRKNYEVVE